MAKRSTFAADPGRRLPRPLAWAAFLVVGIAAWQVAAMAVDAAYVLPAPADVALRLVSLATQPAFWMSVAATLARIVAGFAAGMASGGLLAALMARCPAAEQVFSPFVKILRTTPMVCFVMVALLWARPANLPVVIAALMVMPVAWTDVLDAVRSVDVRYRELAYVWRLPLHARLRLIYLPAMRGRLVASAAVGIGLAWKSGITAEVLALPFWGVGTQIYSAKVGLESADVFAWTAAVVVLSIVLEKLINLAAAHEKRKSEQDAGDPDSAGEESAESAPADREAAADAPVKEEPGNHGSTADAVAGTPEEGSGSKSASPAPGGNGRAAEAPAPGVDAVVKLEGVSKSFGAKQVLDRLSTSFPPRGVFAVTGPSGSGKSTLVRIIEGLEEPDCGKVKVAPVRMAVMFEDDVLLPWLTALQNVRISGCTDARARTALAELGLAGEEDRLPRELSGGMARRVALARALAAAAPLIVLDEPTSRLDRARAEAVAHRIAQEGERACVIVVTHDAHLAGIAEGVLDLSESMREAPAAVR